MLSEEDHQLFIAARKAQVNRNTAIYVLENRRNEAASILRDGIIRVLLEMPVTHIEDYALAPIIGTAEGVPYRGFSTNNDQETTTYLTVRLPYPLAEINGEQYQLNSVSNSGMNESEFRQWIEMLREEGQPLPTVAQLEAVAARVQPLDAARRPAHASRSHLHNNNNSSGRMAGSIAAMPTSNNLSNGRRPSGMFSDASTTAGGGAGGLYPGAPVTGLPVYGSEFGMAGSGGGGGGRGGNPFANPVTSPTPVIAHPVTSSTPVIAHPVTSPTPAITQPATSPTPVIATFSSSPSPPHPQQPQQRVLARDGVSQGRGSLNGYHDGPGGLDGEHPTNAPPYPNGDDGVNPANGRAAGAGGGAVVLQSSTPAKENEETESDRRLRQDIMNHLQVSCTLFPRDSNGYKLSQLRTAERDMTEFLQHVRDEIANKQENCVVCLDHLPTVILLPCKHKALCRLCAATQPRCPICRRVITEMFEPQEV